MSSAQIQGQNGKVKSEPFYQVRIFGEIADLSDYYY